jgi:hypothetical protein
MRLSGACLAVAMAFVVAGAGCATQKKAAQSAINTADSSLKAVAADAQAYVPDLYSAAGAKLAAAKTDFDAAKYPDALAKAESASTQAGSLGAAVTAKKTALAASWKAASDSLPGMLKALQTRVDELAKARRLPAGVTKAAVDGAKKALQEMNIAWTQAQTAYSTGKVADAVQQAGAIQGRAAETMSSLGMKK